MAETTNYRRVTRMGDTLFLYGYVGRSFEMQGDELVEVGIIDADFVGALAECVAEGYSAVKVRINSPGGSTMHARAIMSAIEQCPVPVHTYNDGTAASAAAAIWLMGAERYMARSAVFMLHVASDYCEGNARDMRECADRLDKITSVMALAIAQSTGQGIEEVNAAYFNDYADHYLNYDDCAAAGMLASAEPYDSVVARIESDPTAMLRYMTGAVAGTEHNPKRTYTQRMAAAFERVRAMLSTDTAPAGESLTTTQSLTEMSIQDLRDSLANGTLTADAVQQVLAENAPPPAPAGDPVADAVAALRTEHDTQMATLRTELATLRETMGRLPGAPRATPPMPGADPKAGGAPDDPKAKLERMNAAMAAASTEKAISITAD